MPSESIRSTSRDRKNHDSIDYESRSRRHDSEEENDEERQRRRRERKEKKKKKSKKEKEDEHGQENEEAGDSDESSTRRKRRKHRKRGKDGQDIDDSDHGLKVEEDWESRSSRKRRRHDDHSRERDRDRHHDRERERRHSHRDRDYDDRNRDYDRSYHRERDGDDYYRRDERDYRSRSDKYSTRDDYRGSSSRDDYRRRPSKYDDDHRRSSSKHDDEKHKRHRSESRSRSRHHTREEKESPPETVSEAKQVKSPTEETSIVKSSKFSDAPPRSSKFSDAPSSALPSKPSQPKKLKSQDVEIEPEMELKQGDLEQAKSEADKLRRKMDEEMRIRQEEKKKRLEAWAKEQKEKEKNVDAEAATSKAEPESKAWNLEDDDDDEDEPQLSSSAPLPDVIIPILPAAATVEPEKPKRTAILGAKKVTKKNAIGFGLKSLAPKSLPKVNNNRVILADDDDDDEGKNNTQLSSFGNFLKKQQEEEEAAAKENAEKENDGANMDLDSGAVDPLDTFMQDVHVEVEKKSEEDKIALANQRSAKPEEMAKVLKDVPTDDELEADEEESFPLNVLATSSVEINQADIFAAAAAKAAARKKDLAVVDHSKVKYEDFRKDFYKEPPELSDMTKEQLDQKRLDLDGIRVRGHNCPKPIEKWTQFGLPIGVLEVIKKILKYEAPTPIQAQAIPAIMCGRDVIGIAKTGSGKTIAFLLPMFRQIKDQRPSQGQEGPIGLVMTPTRELALQIFKDCKTFAKPMGLRVACCYGGSPIRDQIADLKRGADIIICTPGRMIDLLCANGGRVTNLKRVTYLVLDEADRMFDMGFEPQVMKMVSNIRPDRQTVLFSATFPRFMEALARKILTKPLEIIVGARSVVAPDVTQIVQIHPDNETKFLKLLAILGKTSDEDPTAKFLIFVDRQEAADTMMSNLMKRGYPCLSLHGGKDQADRDSVISDFKSNTTNILVATSVAARGLDVKDLKVVINYDCPNHLEDYVHRCGRTGRAGNKGTAYTFIMPDQGAYAVEIVKALTMSNAEIPEELKEMADKQTEKVKLGYARIAGSGFGGRGLGRLEGDRDSIRRIQMVAHGDAEIEDEKEEEKGKDENKPDSSQVASTGKELVKPVSALGDVDVAKTAASTEKAIKAAAERAAKLNSLLPHERARVLAMNITRQQQTLASRVQTDAACWAEVEINDYPQKARWKVTSKEQISKISASSNAAITSRGVFVPPGKQPPPGERKLYLFIEADFQHCVERAKEEIKTLLTEATMAAMEDKQTIGRYSVL